MKLYIKQKVFSWGDKFSVYNEYGEDVFFVKGEPISLGKKLHVFDASGNETAFIHQKVISFLPKYYISRGGADIADVVKKMTLFKSKYTIDAFGWFCQGNCTDHIYDISGPNGKVAAISKKWFTWGDTYEIDIASGEDIVNVLCVVLIIDAANAAEGAAT